ncbi:HNH endonuclease family protein [Actinocorallia sp. B10E7]|uniref:HNH endonuclease family protein n=1 Tax=Actinocorallia sp. B10E7 TaxID=3153558 RepID=UPI00325C3C28
MTVEGPSGSDIDYMVPLAEAWNSGAYEWTAQRRQDYANDLGDPRSLVAVTARSNRSKADQDPVEWLPPAVAARCQYIGEWTATKLRCGLSADEEEQTALALLAEECPDVPLAFAPVP